MRINSKLAKFIAIISIVLISLAFGNTKVFAANFNLNVSCDGKKIEMISKTPDMTWNINNMLPGQKDETKINISNVGQKSVKVQLKATIVNGEEVANVLDIKIIKMKNDSEQLDEVEYEGKYADLKEIVIDLDSGKQQEFKVITSLPVETGNEFQEKQCEMKLSFVATGEADEKTPEKEYISTFEIKSPQTGESNAIYIVVAILILAFITLALIYLIQKISR